LQAKDGRVLDAIVEAVQRNALLLWIAGGSITATGRVLADVHW
jgi:hypothetical protein